jgi:hypothetical protein
MGVQMGEESEEVGRASIGLPGIGSVDLPIKRKLLTRITGWCRGHALGDSVRAAHANMEVYVGEADSGNITIYLSVASFWHREVSLESVQLHSISFNHSTLTDVSQIYGTGGTVLSPRSISRAFINVPLRAPDIRRLMQAIRPATNTLSTPDADGTLYGALVCHDRRTKATIRFGVEPVRSRIVFTRDFRTQPGA